MVEAEKHKRVYIIRLYRLHDMDLLSFCGTYKFNFVKGLYCVLTAFAAGETFTVKIPEKRETAIPKFKRSYAKRLTLDEDKDKEVIEMLDMIADGYKNSFMKNLMRLYLCYPLSDEFLISPTYHNYFMSLFEIFRKKRRVAEIGKLKRSQQSLQQVLSLNEEETEYYSEDKESTKENKKNKETAPPKTSLKQKTSKVKDKEERVSVEEASDTNVKRNKEEDDNLTEMFANLLS